MIPHEDLKTAVSFLIATIIISIYGGQVCPFLETLSIYHLSIILVVVFTVGFFLRKIIFGIYFRHLSRDLRTNAIPAGEFVLKGKSEKIEVYKY